MKLIIYQVVVRYFGNTNTTNATDGTLETNGCGKFADINESALRTLKDLGVTHVWLTGCLRQATLTPYSGLGLEADDPDVVKGRAGSLYAIKDEFDVCPDYALQPARRLMEFEALIGRIHEAGLRVLIDFVPNHVARGYHSQVHPELDFGLHNDQSQFWSPQNHFYYLAEPPGQSLRLEKPPHWNLTGVPFDGRFSSEDGGPGRVPKATGNNQTSPLPSVQDWYETVKLNYGFDFVLRRYQLDPPPPVWGIMDQVLAYWQSKGVDGFRCDFAHYIPQQAWTFLIDRARARSAAVSFMAEAYPFPNSGDPITEARQLLDAGFDSVYLDESYDRLKSIYCGAGDQDHYDQLLVLLPEAIRQKSVQYLENHDERRIASPIEPQNSSDNSGFGSMEAAYQLAPLQYLYCRGPVLLLNGQEVGEPGAGEEGFGGNDGRTTIYDYWAMPEFAKWVNKHRYDGALLSPAQRELRGFYGGVPGWSGLSLGGQNWLPLPKSRRFVTFVANFIKTAHFDRVCGKVCGKGRKRLRRAVLLARIREQNLAASRPDSQETRDSSGTLTSVRERISLRSDLALRIGY
jgi:glycosidase